MFTEQGKTISKLILKTFSWFKFDELKHIKKQCSLSEQTDHFMSQNWAFSLASSPCAVLSSVWRWCRYLCAAAEWINSIPAVFWCKSFGWWSAWVHCGTNEWMLGSFDGSAKIMGTCHVHRCTHTRVHTRTESSNETLGNYKPLYWMTAFNIWSRLHRTNTK